MQQLSKFKKTELGEIPQDWKILKLEEIGNLSSGGTPSRFVEEYWQNGTIPWLSSGEIRNKIIIDSNEKITEKGLSESAAKLFPKGTILIAITGQGLTRGRTALLKINSSTNQSVVGIICKSNVIHNIFLLYYLQNQYWNLRNISQGSNQAGLNLNLLKTYKILLPTLKEQQKISTILSNVDKLIQKTEPIIQQTQRLKKGLMQRLLTKRLGHSKFKETESGKNPIEWEFEKISDNSVLKGRIGWQGLTTAEYLKKGEFCLVTGTDFKDGKIDWKSCVYVDEDRFTQDENIQLKKDDVLVTKDGTIGKIAYIDTLPHPTTLNSGIFVIRPIDKAYFPLFLYYVLYSDYFVKFLSKLKGGSTINHLYQKDFVNFKFPVPPYPEQQKIASILSDIDELIQKQKMNKSQIENLKKGLMQQLLTGKIRVKV